MGGELKRVALDFCWPMNKPWKGFLNPHYKAVKCSACNGSGGSKFYHSLKDKWYGNAPFKPEERGSIPFSKYDEVIENIAKRNVGRSPEYYQEYYGDSESAVSREARRLACLFNKSWSHHLNQDDVDALIAGDRLWDFTRVPRNGGQRAIVEQKIKDGGNSWLPENNGYRPTAREVNIWSLSGFGHDAINEWIVTKAECVRLGVSHTCDTCNGEGCVWKSEEDKKKYEDWMPSEPPAGEGWQLWETVSEGSPITPVFKTADELIAHMCLPGKERGCPWDKGYSFEAASKFVLGAGWAPSFVSRDGEFKDGISFLGESL